MPVNTCLIVVSLYSVLYFTFWFTCISVLLQGNIYLNQALLFLLGQILPDGSSCSIHFRWALVDLHCGFGLLSLLYFVLAKIFYSCETSMKAFCFLNSKLKGGLTLNTFWGMRTRAKHGVPVSCVLHPEMAAI